MKVVIVGATGTIGRAVVRAPRGIRVNVVSPPWVNETLDAMGMKGVPSMPAAYVESVEGQRTGVVLDARTFG